VTVYLVARIAGSLLGERAQIRAAWLAALAPSMVWWSAPLMKEAFATMFLMLGVLAVIRLPEGRAVATLAVLLPVLLVFRSSAALALLVGAVVAIALAGRAVERRWISRPLLGLAVVALAGGLAAVLVISHGNLAEFFTRYHSNLRVMFHLYQGANLVHLPYDAVKSLVTPLPWVFAHGTRNWDRALYPGVWVLLCAYPAALVGIWRLRRRPELGLVLGVMVTALLANSLTAGFVFRQRSMVEPLILVLALAGVPSWRVAGRFAAAALGVTAVVAGIQSESAVAPAAILAVAAALLLITRRLPSPPYEPLPESPMVMSFRSSLGLVVDTRVLWLRNLIARVPRSVRAWAEGLRAGVLGRAPKLALRDSARSRSKPATAHER
jgi:hypothetical protein